MSEPKRALSPDQIRAATLLGQGRTQEEVAREVGVSATKTVQRWSRRDDFKALVRQSREAVLEENPTVRSTLEAALSATTKAGAPSWNIRLKASELLMRQDDPGKVGGGSGDEARETLVFLPEDDDEDA